jgi:hypothetical protein
MLTDEPRPGPPGERRRHLRLRAVFDHALQHAPSDRDRYLDEACRGDDELRQQVQRLLAAHAEARTFLEWPRPSLDEVSRELFRQRIPPVDPER